MNKYDQFILSVLSNYGYNEFQISGGEVGDRVAGDIGGPVNVNLPQCKAKCDSLNNCVEFSYQNNICYAKKAEGLAPTYRNNGFQFYTK